LNSFGTEYPVGSTTYFVNDKILLGTYTVDVLNQQVWMQAINYKG